MLSSENRQCVAILAQTIVRPVSATPAESRSVAANDAVAPAASVNEFGVNVTLATGAGSGAVTVTVPVPVIPPLVARIVAVPTETPVTTPLPVTVATPTAVDDQLIVRPTSTVPARSRTTAVKACVAPMLTDGLVGATVTLATAACIVAADATFEGAP